MSGAVRQAATTLRRALADLESGVYSARECATLAEELAGTANACTAASALFAARAASLGAHRERGYSDPASWMAHHSGTTTRQAKQAMDVAKGLERVPGTKDALLAGDVSMSQAQEIAQSEEETPGGEAELLIEAKRGDLSSLREATRERKLSRTRPDDLHRQQRDARFLRHWRDRLGMVRFEGALAPEDGIPFMNRLERRAHRRRRRAKNDNGACERFEAYMADALTASVLAPPDVPAPAASTGHPGTTDNAISSDDSVSSGDAVSGDHAGSADLSGSEDFSGSADCRDAQDPEPRARAELVIVCDLFAWRRGHSHPGEVCHIVGGGPIPVDLARELGQDAFLKAVLHDGVNIHTVSHVGRHRPAALQTALDLGPVPDFTGRACVDCGRRYGLEYDHTDPVNNRGPTSYENLKPRCYIDHKVKTERDRKAGLLGPTAPGRRAAVPAEAAAPRRVSPRDGPPGGSGT
jgi:HNH endonuclease